ncbi:MAG TPA: MIP/aquaporin family protein [Trebonia sp.]|jgi:glycerol uptake facilitator protein|nr:MIP/aquaporin family protein [Trebonia sp.]
MALIRRLFPQTTPLTRLRAGLLGEMLAEFFGTFVLLLLGDGSVALSVAGLPGSGRQTLSVAPFGPANWLIVAGGWGLAVTFGVYVAGGVSGAHLNPAITLSLAARRGFPLRKIVPYWFAQVAGAFCGAAAVYCVYFPAIDWFNATSHLARPSSVSTFSIFATFPAPYFHGAWAGPFVDQVAGTAILVGLVAALTDKRNQAPKGNAAPLLIGLVVAVIGLAYGTNAGYAVNPARDFGPRMFTWALGWGKLAFSGDYGAFHGYWWIPIAGPLAGGLVGIILYDFFIGQVLGAREKAEKPPEPGRVQGGATAAVPAQRGAGNTEQGETPCPGTGTTSARSSST